MIGVLNINKPRGVTSSQVVVKIKKILNLKRVGHMGTLDPLAQGVLPICVGKATRLFDYFLKKQKTYIATFCFGKQTTTLDLEGEIEITSNHIPTKQDVVDALLQFKGKIMQIPPIYSSKKVNGKKAYKEARKGEELELQPCEVEIYDYQLLKQLDNTTFEFKITCSAGTYIRSLARDLGKAVGSCATMTKLVRTKSGIFDLENSIDYDSLTLEAIHNNLISPKQVLADFTPLYISDEDLKKLLNGIKFNVQAISQKAANKQSLDANCQHYSVFCGDQLVGIGVVSDNILTIKTYLI